MDEYVFYLPEYINYIFEAFILLLVLPIISLISSLVVLCLISFMLGYLSRGLVIPVYLLLLKSEALNIKLEVFCDFQNFKGQVQIKVSRKELSVSLISPTVTISFHREGGGEGWSYLWPGNYELECL